MVNVCLFLTRLPKRLSSVISDQGALHKAISYENGMHIMEEIQLFPNFDSIQTLLLSSKKVGLSEVKEIVVILGKKEA